MGSNNKRQMSLEISNKVSKVYDAFRKANAKHVLQHKLTVPQFDALSVLNSHGPVPLKTISEELMVTGANITCVVDNLEKEDLVKRVHSKEDRRVINAELTNKGKTKINNLLPEYVDALTNINQKLTLSEQKQLVRLLDKLIG